MKWKIPLFKIYFDEEDVEAVNGVIRSGMSWAVGKEITNFENKIAEFVGTKHALVFNSGTSALHALLLAHDVRDMEVIVPSFTFIATANAVVLAGGRPVFAEIEEDTFGLNAEDVENRITEKTKAIIPMHYGGCPCRDIEKLRKISKKHGLVMIEDAAESFGSTFNGKMVGKFGDSAIFSFCQNKIITTGEGGAAITDSTEIYRKLKLIRSHGRSEKEKDGYFLSTEDTDYTEAGYNYRIPTMSAALGLSQMSKLDKIVKMRVSNADSMNKGISMLKEITIPTKPENSKHVYQLYTIKVKNEKTRDSLQGYLTKRGVMTKIYFNPIHLKNFYKKEYGYKRGDLPKTENISKRVLSLPMYPNLSKKDIDYITGKIKSFFGKNSGK